MDLTRRVALDPLQDVYEVGIGIDSLQAARAEQALDDPDVLGTDLGPADKPIADLRQSNPSLCTARRSLTAAVSPRHLVG